MGQISSIFKRYTRHDYLFLKNQCVQVPVPRVEKKERKIVSLPSSSSSLDNYKQISLTSTQDSFSPNWTKKQKRAYHCGLSGLKRCLYRGKPAFFLTLTSSPKTTHKDLRKDWDILVKRIRQQLKMKFEYLKVETFEGYGVIHALYHSAFEGWLYADIHAWLSKTWLEIHQANIVWNTAVRQGTKFSLKRCSAYLCQYMSAQREFFRRSTSQNWLFPHYRKRFLEFLAVHGFKKGLVAWEFLLSSPITTSNISIKNPTLIG